MTVSVALLSQLQSLRCFTFFLDDAGDKVGELKR